LAQKIIHNKDKPMKKILSLLTLATLFSSPALAGETFVLNQWKIQQGRTKVDSNIDSTIYSNFNENYNFSTNKIQIERQGTERLNDFTVHNSGSYVNGSFYEETTTRVWGTINTITNSYTRSHESSAGIR
jgi:hypothetical protein